MTDTQQRPIVDPDISVEDFTAQAAEWFEANATRRPTHEAGLVWGEVQGNATSLYDGVYLTGTQGTYGFTELLDETNCYVNGLGAAVAGWDALPWTISAKDGPLVAYRWNGEQDLDAVNFVEAG